MMMTPEQKLKWAILLTAVAWGDIANPGEITAKNVDALYEANNQDGGLQNATSEVRCSGEETNIKAPYSRYYECNSVAAKMPDGTWVVWPYWYGGGKHSEPEAIDWMDDAYDLTCTEEQVTVTQRTFTQATS